MKRALITGSAGFVGRHFERRLIDDGYDVDAIDTCGPDPQDCLDYFNEFTDHAPDLVIHCAAVIGGRKGIDGSPLKLGSENLALDGSLFKWALKARPGRIVYFSSSAAYPLFRQTRAWHTATPEDRLSEHMIWEGSGFGPEIQPDSTYGWSKIAGEVLAREANAEGIPTFVFRPFSGYGTDQDLAYPFPAYIRRAAAHQAPFPVWGSAGSGRDWVHIDDIVEAVLVAMEENVRGPVNICTGIGTTFRQLAVACMVAAGYSADLCENMEAPQGAFWRVGDPTQMETFYRPKISLEEGIWRAMKEEP